MVAPDLSGGALHRLLKQPYVIEDIFVAVGILDEKMATESIQWSVLPSGIPVLRRVLPYTTARVGTGEERSWTARLTKSRTDKPTHSTVPPPSSGKRLAPAPAD